MKPSLAQVLEFLKESNAIEGVYGEHSLIDAKSAWELTKKQPTTVDTIKQTHHALMERINPRIAGNIRECTIYIGQQKKSQTRTQIIMELTKLCQTIPTTEQEIKQWHIDFEHIHPFEDGNGRTGRILLNKQRIDNKLPILIIHTGKEQQNYYEWFRE